MRCLLKQILPGLEHYNVRIIFYGCLNKDQRAELRDFFYERVFPILTPLSVDPSHPFPYISNISMNLGILVVPEKPEDGEEEAGFARVQLPLSPNILRLMPITAEGYCFAML